MAANPALAPVRIRAGALGPALPAQDLAVSQHHRVLVRSTVAARMFGATEILIAAMHLTGVEGIAIVAPPEGVTYVHIIFAAHEIVVSNGAQTESFYPGPQALLALGDAAKEIFTLFPELCHGTGGFPRARPFAAGRKARQLAARHTANGRPMMA